ncbi:EamA family transporter RarD [beta proteobacterium MWH-UniP1]
MSKGVLLSVTASVLFGVLYYYSTLLAPLSGEDIFAWRMIFTIPFMVGFVAAVGDGHMVQAIWKRVKTEPTLILVLLASSAFLGLQLWLFLWAPTANKALEVSLGYFMLPLTMVLTGRVVFKEKLTRWQRLAALSALIGVAHELVRAGSFSIEALAVALGYPVYFVVRKKFGIDHIGGLWFDLVLLLPVAIWFALQGQVSMDFVQENAKFLWLLPILGLLSACALIAYIVSVRYLSFGLFGLLGYVEPVLLLFVALLLGETISGTEYFTYGPIWLAVGFLIIEGILFLSRPKRVSG